MAMNLKGNYIATYSPPAFRLSKLLKVNYILMVYLAGTPTNVSNSSRSSTVKISRAV